MYFGHYSGKTIGSFVFIVICIFLVIGGSLFALKLVGVAEERDVPYEIKVDYVKNIDFDYSKREFNISRGISAIEMSTEKFVGGNWDIRHKYDVPPNRENWVFIKGKRNCYFFKGVTNPLYCDVFEYTANGDRVAEDAIIEIHLHKP